MAKIAIIGGGVAGATSALYLSSLGLQVTLFEKNDSLISGPPFCHLHSGGNLYREISDDQCVTLLHQSIDLLKFYPQSIDYRPTILITPKTDHQEPKDILSRLKLLQKEYQNSINQNPNNMVLGDPKHYYSLFEKKDLEALKSKQIVSRPTTLEEWLIPVAKNIDLAQIKFPIIAVQEFGLNLFRVSASIYSNLKEHSNCKCHFNTKVTNVTSHNHQFTIEYKQNKQIDTENFDYLINAAGFKTGSIDDMLGFKRKRFVEFKAAYVTKWNESKYTMWPEVIFHGQRGTPNGMGQFTPYPNGYFQLHGMTEEITLFNNGLVYSDTRSAQPRLATKFINKIENNWEEHEIVNRTQKAIDHLSQYIPAFKSAQVASKPLFGAQQIPGNDKDLRAADVSFEGSRYARCEIVKASSVLTMIDEIMKQLIALNYVDSKYLFKRDFNLNLQNDGELLKSAQALCNSRDYPTCLANINTKQIT